MLGFLEVRHTYPHNMKYPTVEYLVFRWTCQTPMSARAYHVGGVSFSFCSCSIYEMSTDSLGNKMSWPEGGLKDTIMRLLLFLFHIIIENFSLKSPTERLNQLEVFMLEKRRLDGEDNSMTVWIFGRWEPTVLSSHWRQKIKKLVGEIYIRCEE